MSLPLSRWAAATAALLCLTACSREPNACELDLVPSPLAASDPKQPARDQPRGEDVRLVWVDAAGRTFGEHSVYVTYSIYISGPKLPYPYDYYTVTQGHYLDSKGRHWQVSAQGIRPYPVSTFFASEDCSGRGFIAGYVNDVDPLVRSYFELEGKVVETTGSRISYVPPLDDARGPACTWFRRRSRFEGTTGQCVRLTSDSTSAVQDTCGYALDSLPKPPPPPQTCPTVTSLHLEARALPENERRPCDNGIKLNAVTSPCRASRPGSGYLLTRGGAPLEAFYVDDAHYVWLLTKTKLSGVARSDWYYFTDSSCQGEKYVDAPLDPHQTVGLIGEGQQVGPAYARPPGRVSPTPQTIEARSWAEIEADGGMGPCESSKSKMMDTLIPLSQLITVSPPVLPPFP